ncbi:MAG TPA: glycosyltransferase family 39 protein [Candidatus Binataceae bacterium]|nr:glycosyltransferase family 39 protein [Candidatus Binataceae bacterium]
MELPGRSASLEAAKPDAPAACDGLASWLLRSAETRIVAVIALSAAAIRIYLAITSYCIAADGIAYIAMAREFRAGRLDDALAWVFSPLYPWLIAAFYPVLGDWERAGELLSVILGTAGVVLLYYLMREVYGRRIVAAGAAALAAIHPMLAGFSAAVRTEAGYVALVTAATLLMVRGTNRKSLARIAASGVLCGLAYLYRTEGVGVPVLFAVVLVAGAWPWREWTPRWSLGAAALMLAMFLLIAAPYLVWMRSYTGHWTVGRELGVVTMEATGSTTGELAKWRAMGYRPATSWLTALELAPAAYARKVARDFFGSCYAMVQALGPVLAAAFVVGLWVEGRATVRQWARALLALLVAMYFAGFVLTDTGPRLMSHLVPFTLGWAAIGIEEAAIRLRGLGSRVNSRLARAAGPAIVVVVGLSLLPRTLFPLGYDQRGLRYAGGEIAALERRNGKRTVAGTDPRVAFYADGEFIPIPPRPAADDEDICRWLAAHPGADYLMIDDRTERRWGGVGGNDPCLRLVKRYPRVGKTYYDLFAVRSWGATGAR